MATRNGEIEPARGRGARGCEASTAGPGAGGCRRVIGGVRIPNPQSWRAAQEQRLEARATDGRTCGATQPFGRFDGTA